MIVLSGVYFCHNCKKDVDVVVDAIVTYARRVDNDLIASLESRATCVDCGSVLEYGLLDLDDAKARE